MNDPQTRLVDELEQLGILRRLEFIRARMHAWNLTTGDPGHIDVADPTNFEPDHPMYIRQDHPALAGYYARIRAEGREPAEPDDLDELRHRAGLDYPNPHHTNANRDRGHKL